MAQPFALQVKDPGEYRPLSSYHLSSILPPPHIITKFSSVTPGDDEYGARKLSLTGYPTLLTETLLCC
jgi:hypothetical protein